MSCGNCKLDRFIDIVFMPFSIGIVFFRYFGLVGWFVLTVSLCQELLTALVTNTMVTWDDLPNKILLFVAFVPVLELMWWIAINSLIKFCGDISSTAYYTALSEFIKAPCQDNRGCHHFWVIIFLMIGLGTFPVLIFGFMFDSPIMPLITVFVTCSFIPSTWTFARILLASWVALIKLIPLHRCKRAQPQENGIPEGTVSSAPLIEASERPQEEGTSNPKPPLPIELLDVSEWLDFMISPSSIFSLLRVRQWSWRFVPSALMMCVWIGLLVMDIYRDRMMEDGSDNNTFIAYLDEISADMCKIGRASCRERV
jgi:hypothetical protein